MNQDIKERWVAALRSGQYIQGYEQLRTSDGKFCCLGVLTDLYLKETGQKWDMEVGDQPFLPASVRDWAGLASVNPTTAQGTPLSVLNDDGRIFDVIACEIEEGL